MLKVIFLKVLFLLVFSALARQSDLEKLKSEWEETENDSLRIELFLQMGKVFRQHDLDSAAYFYGQALELVNQNIENTQGNQKKIYRKLKHKTLRQTGNMYLEWSEYNKSLEFRDRSLKIAKQLADTAQIIFEYIGVGNLYYLMGKWPDAAGFFYNAYEFLEEFENPAYEARVYHSLGNVKYMMGGFAQATEYYHKAINYYSLEGTQGVGECYLGLGNIFYEQNDLSRAHSYYKEALNFFEQENHLPGKLNALLNIGNIKLAKGKPEEASVEYERSLTIARESGDRVGIGNCYINMAMVHSAREDFDNAISYYQQGLEVFRSIDNLQGKAKAMINMASLYIRSGDYIKALELSTQSLPIAKDIQALDEQRIVYRNLFRIYQELSNYEKALDFHQKYKMISDSITSLESRKDINRLEALYQHDKMQQQVDLQNALLEKRDAEIQQQNLEVSRQRLQRNGFLIGVLLLTFFSGVIYFNLRQRKKANRLLEKQKKEIEKFNRKLSLQNQEIKATRDELAMQKLIIEQKNQKLLSSIRYAQNIQNALLPEKPLMNKLLKEYFLLFKPREIVSGDFYWVGAQNGKTIFALADSTGHGVPGAFMSMLGLSFLNEVLARKDFSHPEKLLAQMREYIINALHQQTGKTGQNDGLDVALVMMDHGKNSIEFAGARCPVYIGTQNSIRVNGELLNDPDCSVKKIKADLMPVAYHLKMEPFTNYLIELNPGDMIYLMTDGFADQFGGYGKERFTSRKVKRLLENIYNLPVQEQKRSMEEAFFSWKGKNEQVDDVSILGVRFDPLIRNKNENV